MCGSNNIKKPPETQGGNSGVTEIQVPNDHQMTSRTTYLTKQKGLLFANLLVIICLSYI